MRLLWIVITVSITVAVQLSYRRVGSALPGSIPWPVIGVTVFCLGAVLRWWSIRHLGRFFTVDVALATDHCIVDTGPYRSIRHPSYTGLISQLTGVGLTLGTDLALLCIVVAPTLAILHRIGIEEKALRAHFPIEYAAYSARTKKLLPLMF